VASEPAQLAWLALYYTLFAGVFTVGGLGVVVLLRRWPTSAPRLYAGDLVGAGLAALAVAGLLRLVGAEGIVLLASGLAGASATLLAFDRTRPLRTIAWLVVPAAALVLLPLAGRVLPVRPGPSKALSGWLDQEVFPGAHLAFTGWNAISRVDAVEGSGVVAWTVNPDDIRQVPPQVQLLIDGDAATPVISSDGDVSRLDFLDAMVSTTALQALRPERVLVIGAGGGVDVLAAVRNGARHVDAVEVNPLVAELASRRYADFSGRLFQRDDVTLHVAEGRSFVSRGDDRWDLIQVSLIDTWAASAAGAFSLTESYLYTVESFEEALGHLDEDGVLTVTRWLWSPPRETLRLCAVARRALQELGAEAPERHLVVLASDRLGTLLVKRTPFEPGELSRLAGVARRRGFRFVFLPPPSALDNPFTRYLRSPEAFAEGYRYDLSPATDDSPFFFQFTRWRDLLGAREAGDEATPLLLSGRLVMLAMLVQAGVLSLLLLVLPLVIGRRRGAAGRSPHRLRAVLYFFLIGVAFMLLEISLMQRFTLFLGSPVLSVAAVLAALLIAAGVGAATAGRLGAPGRRLEAVFAAIVLGALAAAWGLPALFDLALGLPLAGRLLVALAVLLPLGFVLGMPFPAALAGLGRDEDDARIVAWAWAANGCGSVLGPILGVLVAIDVGFTAVMAVAAAGYAVALAVFAPVWAVVRPDGERDARRETRDVRPTTRP
jgi:hypothetical protein